YAADGHVVHVQYGCGAHSDTELPTGAGSPAYDPFDDAALDVTAQAPTVTAPEPENVAVSDHASEPLMDAQSDS
ncbi:MAG: DUF3027 domain-containing protein, partial [Rhodococcus sp. (in: high G+C Gram-positive bacteria)]